MALILLDFTKAFDMVNHKILLSILNYLGFEAGALDLVSSFLSNRTQRVVLGESASEPLGVVSGVPQGSILGPLLYTVYTSQIIKNPLYCKHHNYADDTQIYFSFEHSTAKDASNCINSDLNTL